MPDNSVLAQLLRELQNAQNSSGQLRLGERAVSSSPSTQFYSGPGGYFSQYGVERDIISTRMHPMGIADMIPAVGTPFTNPLFGFFTGFQAVTGSVANGVCDDPQTAGPGMVCRQTAQLGRYGFQTRVLDITRVGRRTDRSEPWDMRILNDPLLMGTGSMTTPSMNGNPDLRAEVLMRMVEVGVDFQNLLTKQLYYGNPVNSSAGGGYKEFPGLDILIGTGKTDAITNTACPSLDSDIKQFNYTRVDDQGGQTIVSIFSALMHYLKHNASYQNLAPVEWVIAMRENLFWELTAVWPCSYLTWRCINGGDSSNRANLTIDGTAQTEMRDAMRNGQYLVIDGIKYPVVLDDAIVEENRSNNAKIGITCFASDIYVIPMTIRGGFRSTYWEYFNYNEGPMDAAQEMHLGNYYWTDGGKFMWHAKPPTNFCVQQVAVTEPRIILRTPQLAGKINDVQYCPIQHSRDPYPTDPYYVGGGNTTGTPGPSYYNEW